MLRRFFNKKPSILDDAIKRVSLEMEAVAPESEQYSRLIDKLERLVKLKREERSNRISPDTMAIVAGNLIGILIIVAYERNHVMVSKGLGLLRTKQ